MRTRLFKGLIAVFVLSVLTGGFFYMRSNHKHEQVKARYDTYMAQLDDLSVDEDGFLKPITDAGNDPEYDAIYEKKEKARNYLMKHAPHLLPEDDKKSSDDLNNELVEAIRKRDPEAASRLESQFAENKRIAKAQVEAELAVFKQELIDHEAQMEASRKRRESFELEILERKRESQALHERLDRLMDKMREHGIFDANGNLVGVKPPSVAPSDSDVSVPPVGSDASQDRSPAPHTDSVGASDSEIPAAPAFNPQLWRESINSEMADLDVGLSDKYPDVMIRSYLSDAEYQTLFPTEASRQQLQRRTTALQTEYASGIRKMLSKTPRDRQSQMLEIARQALSKDWDSDFVDAVIEQLQLDQK